MGLVEVEGCGDKRPFQLEVSAFEQQRAVLDPAGKRNLGARVWIDSESHVVPRLPQSIVTDGLDGSVEGDSDVAILVQIISGDRNEDSWRPVRIVVPDVGPMTGA